MRLTSARLKTGLQKIPKPRFNSEFAGNLRDELTFIKKWMEKPRTVGAIAPTSKKVARLMASHIDRNSSLPVLELGPGTGVITKAILEHGIDPARLVCVEYSEEFCHMLRERFPDIHIIQGDAYDLQGTLAGSGFNKFSAVVSGLPLLNQKPELRCKLVHDALGMMDVGQPFVQFSYGFVPPLSRQLAGDVIATPSNWVIGNVPPARVWTYCRRSD